MLEPVHAAGGSVHFVQLTCQRHELLRRIELDSRQAMDKLVDPVRLADLLARFDMFSGSHLPRVGQHLCLDVTHAAPSESARRIIQHYAIASFF
jgi:hypothetical protein